jgi:hypothetical protein
MDPRTLDDYNIKWTLIDEHYAVIGRLENETNFDTSLFEMPDGEFLLMVDITLEQVPEFQETASKTFVATRPPRNGECEISDDLILIGSTVSIKCMNWESSKEPLVYRVYQNGIHLT